MTEHHSPSNELSREEWLRRYRQRFVKVAGFTDAQADDAARAVCTGPGDDVGFIELSDGFENEPEAAADEEMSYWEGNGDE